MSEEPWAAVKQVPRSTMGYGGGTVLIGADGVELGTVITFGKSPHCDSAAVDDAVHRCLKDRTAAIRWANQSVEMLKDAFFPLAETLRSLEAYLRDTPHHNAPEAAAARKVLAAFDNAWQDQPHDH